MTSSRAGAKRRIVRRLCRLFPRAFRAAHGDELEEIYVALDAPLAFVVLDLTKNAILVRWDALRLHRTHRLSHQRTRGGNGMDSIWNDLRFALRSLRNRPVPTAMILVTLTIGIGSATTLFTVVDRVVLRPLPFSEPERIVRVWWRPDSFNQRIIAFFEAEAESFETLAAYSGWAFTILGDGEPEELQGAVVTPNYFDVLGVEAMLGRTFRPEESEPGRSDVVVLSHGLWVRRFGSDPSIVGKRIQLSGAGRNGATVIGILPPAHVPVDPGVTWHAYLPLERAADLEKDNSWFLSSVARLAPGVTTDEATAEALHLAALVRETMYPRVSEEDVAAARVASLGNVIVGDETRSYLALLAAVVGGVLVLVCANVGSLLLTRYAERTQEIALRSALGAGRGRVMRQLTTESLVVAFAGGIPGAAVAALAVQLIAPRVADALPHAAGISVDLRVLGFALLTSCSTAILFGTLPALRASRCDGTSGVGSGRVSAPPSRRPLQRLLVVAEVGAALVFLAAAALMVSSLLHWLRVDPGFDADRVLIVGVNAPETRYPEPASTRALYRELLPRLEAIPGVTEAGAIHLLPMSSGNWNFPYYPEGRIVGENESPPDANFRVVTPGYFRAMGIPLVSGRDFETADRDDAAPVGMINERMASLLWPGEDAVGRRLRILSPTGPEFEIVGVVGDIRQHGLDVEPRPEMYRPLEQWTLSRNLIALRTDGDPEALAPAAREAIRELAPDLPVVELGPMSDYVGATMAASRVVTMLLGAFSALALVLAVVGVYGVASSVVTTRAREIGIRMALGASASEVRRETLAREMLPIGIGVAIGLVGGVLASRVMTAQITGLARIDGETLASLALFVIVVGLVACWVPARRASRVEPTTALRFH